MRGTFHSDAEAGESNGVDVDLGQRLKEKY